MLALYISGFVFALLLLPMLFGRMRKSVRTVPLEVRQGSSATYDDFDPHTVPVFKATWSKLT